MTHTFGQFIYEKRTQKEMSLREFCRRIELDPSNWSKIENGLADPPKSKEALNKIAEILEMNTEEQNSMMDLALIAAIPDHLRPSQEVLRLLPIFFRTTRRDKPTRQELERLLKKLTK
jgi:transcriptional regulator with XRE-family HTH domain